MTNSFWVGGAAAYEKGLKLQYETQLDNLRKQLEQCEIDAQQLTIKEQIEVIETEYRTKLKANDKRLLF